MTLLHSPLDSNGSSVKSGDLVCLLEAPDDLLRGLEEGDVIAIKAVVGSLMKIEEFDEFGHAELMFRAADDRIHFIWVAPKYLRLQAK